MRIPTFVLLAALSPTLGGCMASLAGSSAGSWSDVGFERDGHGWKVSYADGGQNILGSDWRLENWTKESDGRWQQKTYDRWVDANGNGVIEPHEQRTLFLDDLRFANVRNNGAIWLDSATLDEADAGKDLEVLLENYIANATRSVESWRRDLEADLSSRSDVELSHHKAVSALVELRPKAQVGQERKNVQFRKVHLVLTRFDFLGEPEPGLPPSSVGSLGMEKTVQGTPGTRPRLTAILVVGYVNDNERFDASLGDFAKLLAQITLPDTPPATAKPAARKGKSSAKPQATPSAPAPPAGQKAPPAGTAPTTPAKPPIDRSEATIEI